MGSVGSIITGNWSTSSEGDVKAESGISTPGTKLLNSSSIIRNVNEWNANNDYHVTEARPIHNWFAIVTYSCNFYRFLR